MIKQKLTVKPPMAFALLGISSRTGYRWIRSGKIATIKIGNRFLIPASEIERLLS